MEKSNQFSIAYINKVVEKMKKKKSNYTSLKITLIVIFVLVCIALLLCVYKQQIQLQAAANETARVIPWDELNDEIVAWVEVPGTNIDEPIVQAKKSDPNKYLHYDIMEKGRYGSAYIDVDCALNSNFTMIYGHHLNNGRGFSDFAKFSKTKYAKKHSEIIVYRRNDTTLYLHTVAVDCINAYNNEFYIPPRRQFAQFLNQRTKVLEIDAKPNKIFAFCTCSYDITNGRTIVYAC